MGSNSFGTIFRITTWGESHGKAMGVVIDGCPAGLHLHEDEINRELALRAPGGSPYTSPRKEADLAEIYSGLFEGKTTGAPLSIIIKNQDSDSAPYHALKETLRPGHANFTYLEKYGLFDYRGGGRASARETVCRVAAGAVAKKLLAHFRITLSARIGDTLKEAALEAKEAHDSIGGIVELTTSDLPTGLGDPIYEKLSANLAKAIFSIPAVKGFEIGSGFASASMRGSAHNDPFTQVDGKIRTKTNHAGGILGGITTGMPLVLRVAFKPASSIKQEQESVTVNGEKTTLKFSEKARHDPCVAIRAVPVVEAMCALVLADHLLMNRLSKL
jgi:chorismate synthase